MISKSYKDITKSETTRQYTLIRDTKSSANILVLESAIYIKESYTTK